jgi:predicted transcriptional regulator
VRDFFEWEEDLMSEASQTIQQKVHALAEELPPDASWDDVIDEARFRKAVELGIAAADRGAFATDEEVRSAFARWGAKI